MTHNEYKTLCNEVNNLNDAYYKQHTSLVPDEVFDFYLRTIEDAEREHPEWVTPDSPTQHVGSDLNVTNRNTEASNTNGDYLDADGKVIHRIPMLSTAKVKNVNDLLKWMKKTYKATGDDTFTMEWKYDGLSCSIVYEDGKLHHASTRGDGDKGNDVTEHVRLMKSVPHTIPVKGRVEVRGEVVMPFSELEEYNARHLNLKDKLSNVRNAASGALGSNDPTDAIDKGLQFYAFDIMLGDDAVLDKEVSENTKAVFVVAKVNHYNAMRLTMQLGFKSMPCELCSFSNVEELVNECDKARNQLPIAVDGLVIKIRNSTKREQLGRTDHHPHYLVAYKFADALYETTLRKVDMQVGAKTGKLTPVAYFDAVTIDGVRVDKASCGSEDVFNKMGIQPGDRILVKRSGGVIPQVVGKA